MKRVLYILALVLLSVSCRERSRSDVFTYEDAEKEFVSSLTVSDTSAVLSMTDAFMEKLRSGMTDSAVVLVNVLEDGVLYASSDNYRNELRLRFALFPVLDYELTKYSFSTPGNNDVCYTYKFNGDDKLKLVFNPVKVDSVWYITLKDGTQSSSDLPENRRVHPRSPAPSAVRLHTK